MEKEPNEKRIFDSIKVARLYYESGLGQAEIASQLAISRPTVSRLLQFAQDQGYVQIKIVDPYASVQNLERALEKRYGLSSAHVVYTSSKDYTELTTALGKYAAEYLSQTVKDNDIIGVSWGKTMYQVARHLGAQTAQNVALVELKGSVTYTPTPVYAEEILMTFSQAFHTAPNVLPLPVIFGTQTTHDIVVQDRHIHKMIELGQRANIAIYTVGTVRDDALLFQTGYFSETEQAGIQAHAVGDICSRFYDAAGNVACPEIDRRTVGVQLADLAKKEHSILVAGGERKFDAIKGALAGGYPNCLITDIGTAHRLIDEAD
ncbi:RNA polymerase subunit sigma-70 [Secundilactobacillus kimchicus]|uniref:DeoR protein n=1 Tax=Secundilactobacillus kimchicus JCM 15530 TaxID=1302272 RepID=A0A0R1HX29_9LACO|nr:sugar-binding transcriptional regulator [Secundilactobacillus kimchicus]KRK47930.1 deoR protein [Secundilactobacillus kimchicus JCM 15530]MBT9671467.1 RNA polymerase subunit sigma-70 [Secundilactobacillus kimchicus]